MPITVIVKLVLACLASLATVQVYALPWLVQLPLQLVSPSVAGRVAVSVTPEAAAVPWLVTVSVQLPVALTLNEPGHDSARLRSSPGTDLTIRTVNGPAVAVPAAFVAEPE